MNEKEKCETSKTILVKYKGWGSPAVKVRIAQSDYFENIFLEGQVIWKMECINSQMWAPGEYDIYKIWLAEPGEYKSQEQAKEEKYSSCVVRYLAIRREKPVSEPEEFEKLLVDFQPHLSNKHFQELLKKLEGKTSEEKKEIIIEEMEELTTSMSYY